MKKNQVEFKRYLAPKYEIIALDHEATLLAASPNAQPGGGGGGNIHVNPLDPDEDEDVSGAKRWSAPLWEDEE